MEMPAAEKNSVREAEAPARPEFRRGNPTRPVLLTLREGMHSQPESLIFDFDGVLADTEPLYWKAWRELLLPHGIELSWEEYCRIGRGVKDDQMLLRIPKVASSPAL